MVVVLGSCLSWLGWWKWCHGTHCRSSQHLLPLFTHHCRWGHHLPHKSIRHSLLSFKEEDIDHLVMNFVSHSGNRISAHHVMDFLTWQILRHKDPLIIQVRLLYYIVCEWTWTNWNGRLSVYTLRWENNLPNISTRCYSHPQSLGAKVKLCVKHLEVQLKLFHPAERWDFTGLFILFTLIFSLRVILWNIRAVPVGVCWRWSLLRQWTTWSLWFLINFVVICSCRVSHNFRMLKNLIKQGKASQLRGCRVSFMA